MPISAAFLLGFIGSLHCMGMCGPLVLALPSGPANSPSGFVLGRVIYHTGRMATYCAMGALMGGAGQSLALAGFQQWLSLTAGLAILLGWALSTRSKWRAGVWHSVAWLKLAFAQLLRRKSWSALFGLGAINGLLPCGLVYVAAAGSAASGHILAGMETMLAFGLGTLPMMLGISLAGNKLQLLLGWRLQKLIPLSVVLVGSLLILRGLSLGIPYLSPDLTSLQLSGQSCH